MSNPQLQQEVDRQVQALFARSPAFHQLEPLEQRNVMRQTAEIVETIATNKLRQGQASAKAKALNDPYALALDSGTPQMPTMPGGAMPPGTMPGGGQQPSFTGGAQPGAKETFTAEDLKQFGRGLATGVQEAGELLRQVNFPAFVAELIQGVFQAVVDASISQMRAYAEMVQSVTMSLNDFRDANVTNNQARDHLVSKFPNIMQVNITDQGPKVGLRPGADLDELPNIAESLGMDQPITDLDEETLEEILVPAARNDLARSRQTLLATMLLMGINRISVTDGKINATLKFNFKSQDTYQMQAQDYDYSDYGTTTVTQSTRESTEDTGESYKEGSSGSFWSRRSHRSGESSRWLKDTTQTTSTPAIYLDRIEESASAATMEAQAKLASNVSLNFKTESVNLDQLVSQADIFKLERVRSAGRGAPPGTEVISTGKPVAKAPEQTPA